MIRRLAVARVPMVQDYGFLIRFMVLFTVWGTIAFTFRLYVNLSWTGLILSALFMVASILVFIGFWTRSAMAALGLIVLLQAYVQHKHWAMAVGVLPIVSALLPLGGLYSLDRYLQLGRKPRPYLPITPAAAVALPTGLRVLFVALVVFIIGGPAYNEIFHHHSKVFRSWDMYHIVGKNVVMVEFFTDNGGSRQHIDYMRVIGHVLKPGGLVANFTVSGDMAIMGTKQLDDMVSRVCGRVDDPTSLRLDAKIATLKQGWLPLFHGDEQICDATGKPLLKAKPVPKTHDWQDKEQDDT